MTELAQEIVDALPSLRRYAYALAGDPRRGDHYLGVAFAVLAEEPWHVRSGEARYQLYRLFHRVLDALHVHEPAAAVEFAAEAEDARQALIARLQALPLLWRKVVLLTAVERLPLPRAAALVELSPEEARTHLACARRALAGMPAHPHIYSGREAYRSWQSPWRSEFGHA